MKKRANQQGFTLMELMVVIVIVAILAAEAVPLYINYVRDAKRTEAKGAIAAVISAEQVYYQNNNTYTTDMTKLKVDITELSRNWQVTVDSASDTKFKVSATGKTTGDANGLYACCSYDRNAAPQWGESTADCP